MIVIAYPRSLNKTVLWRRKPYKASEQREVCEDRRVGKDIPRYTYKMLEDPEMRRFELYDK